MRERPEEPKKPERYHKAITDEGRRALGGRFVTIASEVGLQAFVPCQDEGALGSGVKDNKVIETNSPCQAPEATNRRLSDAVTNLHN